MRDLLRDNSKRKYILAIIILSAILIGQIGCRNEDQPGVSYDVGVVFTSSKKPMPKGKPDKGVSFNYRIKPGAKFSGTYIIENNQPKRHKYLAMALLDYKQVPLTLDKNKSIKNILKINRLTKKRYLFETEPLQKGFHDFTILLFFEPFNHSLDNDYRWGSDGLYNYPQRANINVDKKKPAPVVYNTKGKLKKDNSRFEGVFIKKNQNENMTNWSYEEASPGKKVNYYIHVGNTSSKTLTYALMVFLDFKQIPASKGQPAVLYLKLKPKEKIVIPAGFNAPKTKGVHELFAMTSVNPFAVQTIGSRKDKAPISYDFFSTIRTAIVVK